MTTILKFTVQQVATPTGLIMPFGGSPTPGGWLWCHGTAVSRAMFTDLFKVIGTTFGHGDGSTTFNLPDLQGRVLVGSGQGPGLTNRDVGDKGGVEAHQLLESQMPEHLHGAFGLSAFAVGNHSHPVDIQSNVQNRSHRHSGQTDYTNPSHNHSYQDYNTNLGVLVSGPVAVGGAGVDLWRRDANTGNANINHRHGFTTGNQNRSHRHNVVGNAEAGGTHGHAVIGETSPAGDDGAHENMSPFTTVNFIIKT